MIIRNTILQLLKEKNVLFQHIVHREGTVSHIVAKDVGIPLEEGIKCLILCGKKTGKNYLVCMRGHHRADMKKIAELLGEKCEFEKKEIIKEKYNLEVGAIPPFGQILGIDSYMDEEILQSKQVIFSCGLTSESIHMKLEDLLSLIQPKFVSLAQEFVKPC